MSILKKIILTVAYFICLFIPCCAAESVNNAESPAELDEEIMRRIGFGKGS